MTDNSQERLDSVYETVESLLFQGHETGFSGLISLLDSLRFETMDPEEALAYFYSTFVIRNDLQDSWYRNLDRLESEMPNSEKFLPSFRLLRRVS